MTIPDSAIEAAHKAWREQAKQDGTIFEYNLRAAIEAAAPYLMGQAWNAALQEADDQGYLYGHQSDLLKLSNPYR